MSATLAFHYPLSFRFSRSINIIDVFTALAGLMLAVWLATGSRPSLAEAFRPVALVQPVVVKPEVAPPVEPDQPEAVPETLSPQLQAALESVSRRYRVSEDGLQPVFAAAQIAARQLKLDPLLIIAVIGIESGFNPFSQSVAGAQGLMQVIPRYHPEKIPADAGDAPLLDPVTNVQVGARVLEESIRRNGGLLVGLQQFGGALSDPEQRYANRVMAEKERLEKAAAARARTKKA